MRSPSNLIAVLVSGLGVGWLAGLAVTPVLNTVLASVVGIAVAVVSVMIGLPSSGQSAVTADLARTSALPLMLLIVGLATGATLGLYARVNGWVFSSAQKDALATSADSAEARGTGSYHLVGLFNDVVPAECTRFRSQMEYPAQLQGEMAGSSNALLRAVATSPSADSAILVQVVEAACATD